MNTITSKIAVLAVCALGAAAMNPAHATVIFDFTDPVYGSGNQGHMQTYTQGTKNLTVHAFSTILPDLPGDPASISNNVNGLGVIGDGDNNQVDNIGDEGIIEWLAFSTTTGTIEGVTIHQLTNGEEADFWRATAPDGTPGTFTFLFTLNGITGTDQFVSIDLAGDPYLLVSSGETESGFRVENVHVPEPATLALFGLGLAGLGFARRKRMS